MATQLSQNGVVSTTMNYLVPANGNTNSVLTAGPASAVPQVINWTNFQADQLPGFIPQGLYADNTAGTANLVMTCQTNGFVIVVPPGVLMACPFPAPPNQVWQVTGNNANAQITWVNYPVFPFVYQGSLPQVVTISGQPVSVTVPANVSGAPYQTENVPYGAVLQESNGAAPANTNLRKLLLSISGDAAMAAAGRNVLTVTLNGNTVFSQSIYLPAAAPASPLPVAWQRELDFSDVAFNAGSGNLSVTLGTALTSGVLEYSAYYD